jgi:signal transduction histidine kinase
MVKNIVQTYEGTIDFQSVPNKKTTFTVCFPTAPHPES